MCSMMASYADRDSVKVPDILVPYYYSTLIPVEARRAIDNDIRTIWTLTDGQIIGFFTAEFDQPYTVSDTQIFH